MRRNMHFLYERSVLLENLNAVFGADLDGVGGYSGMALFWSMMVGLGVGGVSVGMFHLLRHAFFKALLFLGAGSIIHGCHEEQDIRKMGGLRHRMPITAFTFLIGAVSLAGLPPLGGFFSKDEILYETFHEGHTLLWLIAGVASLLTAIYMFRLVFLTFHGERRRDAPESSHPAPSHLHDAPPAMALVLVVLAIGSVVALERCLDCCTKTRLVVAVHVNPRSSG